MHLLRWLRDHAAARYALAVVVALPALLATFLAAAIGHCSSFGGRCPSEPQPWWDNDVFGLVGIGMATVAFVIGAAALPTRRGVVKAAVVAAAVGVVSGLMAATWAAG